MANGRFSDSYENTAVCCWRAIALRFSRNGPRNKFRRRLIALKGEHRRPDRPNVWTRTSSPDYCSHPLSGSPIDERIHRLPGILASLSPEIDGPESFDVHCRPHPLHPLLTVNCQSHERHIRLAPAMACSRWNLRHYYLL